MEAEVAAAAVKKMATQWSVSLMDLFGYWDIVDVCQLPMPKPWGFNWVKKKY
jgi:hypothetical protein